MSPEKGEMPLRYKDFGDRIRNAASALGVSGLHSKIEADGTWAFNYSGDAQILGQIRALL